MQTPIAIAHADGACHNVSTGRSTLKAESLDLKRLLVTGIACLALALAAFGSITSRADGAASTKSANPPTRINATQIQSSADLSLDCTGTVGCWNYMKIERARWYGLQFIGGAWALNNGWNNITVNLPGGCYWYRTAVNSYNDYIGPVGSGQNIGAVGSSSNGQQVYRYRTPWSSGWAKHCR